MRSTLRALLAAALIFSPVVSAATGADAETSKGTVRIGLLDPISGAYAPEGQEVDAGFRYYLATHDNALGGFRVELRTADEGETPDSALGSAHQLIEQDAVDAIVGLLRSNDALAVASYLDEQKKPIVITSAGAENLTEVGARKSFARVADTPSQDTMPLGDYVCRRLGKRTAAIVAQDAPFGWESAGGFARTFTEAGCRIVQETYFAEDTTDWNALATKIDRRAQIVFASTGSSAAPQFLAAFRANGPKATLVGSGLLTDERVLGAERENALGAITALHYSATLANAQNTAFRLGYESVSGHTVSQLVENGFVAAAALSTALGHLPAGSIKGETLAAELRGVAVIAPRGPLRFDVFGQVVDAVYVRRVDQVGGRFRNDVIATYPNVSQFWRYDPVRYLQFPPYEKLKGSWTRP